MTPATKLADALARIPTEEIRELRLWLAGKRSWYSGPYGFTSKNIMVRGGMVNVWDEEPTTIARVRRALGVQG